MKHKALINRANGQYFTIFVNIVLPMNFFEKMGQEGKQPAKGCRLGPALTPKKLNVIFNSIS